MIFQKKEEINKLKEEVEYLKKEIEELRKQNKEYLNGWQRAKADYLNREREIERERNEWFEFANLNLILEILPIYEHFNQALEHQNKNEDFIKGLEQIKKQFEDLFKKLGVEKIKTVGEKFNPEFHEVVEKRDDGDEIIEEISPGYTINNKVIKVAKVAIGKRKNLDEEMTE
ncbi:MAG: nucleotide exchange factor GrpE [Patescibacteria group bacterium]|nr:nucleotide exchange factor GrpE [Patescibacteria group bacterium]